MNPAMVGGIKNGLDFTGRRVLVTGGGRGIGKVMVQQFVELGATVFVFDKDPALLTELKSDLPTVTGIQVDLSDWEATKKAAASILPIHHLVNNAAVMIPKAFFDIEPSDINQMFSINFNALLAVSQVISKGMIDHGIKNGTIVNITSESDSRCFRRPITLYSCSKAAVTQLTKILAVELGDHGIRVNAVRPSVVRTEMMDVISKEEQAKLVASFKGRMVFPRLVEPDEIARAAVYLSSQATTMMTGTVLTVDGGKDLF